MQSNPLFRTRALERLSSPERLDALMQVTSPKGWLALYTVAGLLACVLIWSIVGSVPTRVDGEGMLIRGGNLREIRASGAGEVKALSLRINAMLKSGQEVGELVRPDFAEAVRSLAGKYAQAMREASAGEAEDRTTMAGLNSDIQAKTGEIRTYTEQLQKAQEDMGIKKGAFDKGLITRSRVTGAERDVVSIQGQITSRNEEIRGHHAQIRTIEQRIRARYALAASIRLDLDGLKNSGQSASALRSPVDGRVVEIKKRPGDSVTPGEVVAVVEPESVELEPVVYVNSTTGKDIRAGMDAQVSPSTVKREEYGFMVAKVTSVGEYPATPEAVLAAVANNALAKELIGSSAKIEIRARLAPDGATPSGYQWSSSTGPAFRVQSGTRVRVSVVVDRRAPITLVLPTLRRAIGL
jgi:HlyD family secretion protein